jgi:hypothetical protein
MSYEDFDRRMSYADKLLREKAARERMKVVMTEVAEYPTLPPTTASDKYTGWGPISPEDAKRIMQDLTEKTLIEVDRNAGLTQTGAEMETEVGRQIYVRRGDALRIFGKTLVPEHRRDVVRGIYEGREYEADALIIMHGGWWKETGRAPATDTSKAIPANGRDLLKQFTAKVLEQGQYDDLEKIATPKPGEQFDMNQLAVAAVLTLNKAVDVIEDLQRRVDELEARETVERAAPPSEPAFQLRKLGDEYGDVRKTG